MGNGCFKSVGELKLIGLKKLEKVMIGEKCFTQENGSFTLKECDALKELKIGNGSFDDYSVCEIDSLNSLEVIEIGNGCFHRVGVLKLIGLKKLEKVIIGEKCFMWWCSSDPNRQFCLKECDSLKELKIGNGSFREYTVCEIDSLNSLEVIEMGNGCFENVGELKLIGLKKLEKVMIGEKCFTQENGSFTLKECDALKELKSGDYSFCGYSVCEIDSLNSLEVIAIGGFRGASLELKSHSQRMK